MTPEAVREIALRELPGFGDDALHEAWNAWLKGCERPAPAGMPGQSALCTEVRQLAIGTPDEQAPVWLIHNRRLENCRITVAPGRRVGSSLVIDRLTAKRLQLQPGNSVRAVPLPNQQQQAVAA